MNTDTAILLLLADMQAQIVALKAEVERLTPPPTWSDLNPNPHENTMPC